MCRKMVVNTRTSRGGYPSYGDNDENNTMSSSTAISSKVAPAPAPRKRTNAPATLASTTSLRRPTNSRTSKTRPSCIKSKTTPATSRCVTFGYVHIREYENAIGSCSVPHGGVPIGITWNYARLPKQTLDDYECNRSKTRRSNVCNARNVLLISPMERFYFVLSLGVDIYQIEQTLSECSKIHFSRTDTNKERRESEQQRKNFHPSSCRSSSRSNSSQRHTNKKRPWVCFKNRFQRSRR